MFPEEGPAGGCASGECLPDAEAGVSAASEGRAATPQQQPTSAPQPMSAARWKAAVEHVRAGSSRHGISLAFGRLAKIAPGEVTLYYPPEGAFHRTVVSSQSGKALVEKLLAEVFQQPTRVLLTETAPAGTEVSSIGETEVRERVQREKAVDAGIRSHPSVRAVLRMLGGEIEHVQVLEQERPAPRPVETADE